MKNALSQLLICILLGFLCDQCLADDEETSLLASLRRAHPSTPFESVAKTPIHGIYEIVIGKRLYYSDTSGRYFLSGSLVDMQTHQDLSASKRELLARIDVAKLPLADAFTHVRGVGSRKVYLFSDPDCPYCRTLQSELEKVDDLAVVVFEYPLTSLHPEAESKAISIWCATDDAARWNLWHEALIENRIVAKSNCSNPIARNVALGENLKIRGTPTLISSDGRVMSGMATVASINQWLAKTSK